VPQDFEAFLVQIDESLQLVTPHTVLFWLLAMSHREQSARAHGHVLRGSSLFSVVLKISPHAQW
jgi:hypothetical protein